MIFILKVFEGISAVEIEKDTNISQNTELTALDSVVESITGIGLLSKFLKYVMETVCSNSKSCSTLKFDYVF